MVICCCNYFKQTSKSHSKNRLFKYSDVRKCKYLVESNEHTKDWSKKKKRTKKKPKNKQKTKWNASIAHKYWLHSRSLVGVRYTTHCGGKKCAHATSNKRNAVNEIIGVRWEKCFNWIGIKLMYAINNSRNLNGISKWCFALIAGPVLKTHWHSQHFFVVLFLFFFIRFAFKLFLHLKISILPFAHFSTFSTSHENVVVLHICIWIYVKIIWCSWLEMPRISACSWIKSKGIFLCKSFVET